MDGDSARIARHRLLAPNGLAGEPRALADLVTVAWSAVREEDSQGVGLRAVRFLDDPFGESADGRHENGDLPPYGEWNMTRDLHDVMGSPSV